MSDTVCASCHVPKPSCCFDYADSDGTVCQPCHRDQMHNARARRAHSPLARMERKRRTERILATNPDRYANGLASLVERIEG